MSSTVDTVVGRFVQEDPARVLVSCDSYAGPVLERHIETGIREMTAVSVAAGLAASGLHPVVLALNVFVLTRALAQLRQDVVLNALPVTIVGKASGLELKAQGPSHCMPNDLLVLKSLAPMVVACPSSADDLERVLAERVGTGPAYLRVVSLDRRVNEERPPVGSDLPVVTVITAGGAIPDGSLRAALGTDIKIRTHALRYVEPLDEDLRTLVGTVVIDETNTEYLSDLVGPSLVNVTRLLTWNSTSGALTSASQWVKGYK